MVGAILAFLAFIAVLTLVYRFTVKGVGKQVGHYVHDRHRHAEEILEGHHVPRDWQDEIAGMDERRAKDTLLRRLEKLARYFAKTRLVDSENTRQIILNGFADTATEWESRPLSENLNAGPGDDVDQNGA